VDSDAFSWDLQIIRNLFFLCHDVSGNQVGWPGPGSMADQDSEIVFGFAKLRELISRKMKRQMDDMTSRMRK